MRHTLADAISRCSVHDFWRLEEAEHYALYEGQMQAQIKSDIEERVKSVIAAAKREMEQYGLDNSTLDIVLAEAVTT
jgi:hypothetical protein